MTKYEIWERFYSDDNGKTWSSMNVYKVGDILEQPSDCIPSEDYDFYERWQIDYNNFECYEYDKYYLEYKQVSRDNEHWYDSQPLETRRSEQIAEIGSPDCIYYRWVERQDNYECVGTSKYAIEIKQKSPNGINNWEDIGETRRGRLIEINSYDCGYSTTRWVNVEDDFDCDTENFLKYSLEKEQITYNGINWEDTGNQRRGAIIEVNSVDCGYEPSVYEKWVVIEDDFICVGYAKYELLRKYTSLDGTDWIPTDETKRGNLIEQKSVDCGYEPLVYVKWVEGDDVCGSEVDENKIVEEISERWITIEDDFECDTETYTKYSVEEKQTSIDGTDWEDTGERRRGSVIEEKSADCGYEEPYNYEKWEKEDDVCGSEVDESKIIEKISERWVVVEDDFECDTETYTKYSVEEKQTSIDGTDWEDTGERRRGSVIEEKSADCGYEPYPLEGCKVDLTFVDGTTRTDSFPNCIIPNEKYGENTNITNVIIGKGITYIGGYVFSFCTSLTSVVIPNSVTKIDTYAFYKCSGLTSVVIPDSVTNFGEGVFNGCSGLTSVGLKGSGASVEMPNSVTSISDSTFTYCRSLTSVTIPNSVTSIGNNAFSVCMTLTSITIPNSVTKIGDNAFSNCQSLASINYNGTIEQWNSITKGVSWKYYVPTTCKVHCTDGDISI